MKFLRSRVSRVRGVSVPAATASPMSMAILSTAIAATLSFVGCGSSGPSEAESKMTSYSTNDTKADTAALFTVPQDQMAHLQIASAKKERLPRVLRLTGAVAYNAFATTPVFSAVGGFTLAAHPDSPKPELQWRGRNLPIDRMSEIGGRTPHPIHWPQPESSSVFAFSTSLSVKAPC